jgi:hypothetical protein
MEAFDTIRSYSVSAAVALRDAVSAAGLPLFTSRRALPYDLFFETMPKAHVSFFEKLSLYYRGSDGICVHGGLDSHVPALEDQTVEASRTSACLVLTSCIPST